MENFSIKFVPDQLDQQQQSCERVSQYASASEIEQNENENEIYTKEELIGGSTPNNNRNNQFLTTFLEENTKDQSDYDQSQYKQQTEKIYRVDENVTEFSNQDSQSKLDYDQQMQEDYVQENSQIKEETIAQRYQSDDTPTQRDVLKFVSQQNASNQAKNIYQLFCIQVKKYGEEMGEQQNNLAKDLLWIKNKQYCDNSKKTLINLFQNGSNNLKKIIVDYLEKKGEKYIEEKNYTYSVHIKCKRSLKKLISNLKARQLTEDSQSQNKK